MRMRPSWKKDKHGMGVTRTAVLVVTEPGAIIDLSMLNRDANKAIDQSWKIGDQAMNKDAYGISPLNRGCP